MQSLQNTIRVATAALLMTALLMGCAETFPRANLDDHGFQKVEGQIWYRERMLLSPEAEITVAIENAARMDAPADVLASTRFSVKGRGGPPWYFSVAYDPGRLEDTGRYVLRARIELDGQLLFSNTDPLPAFDQKPGALKKIMVSQTVGAQTGKTAPSSKPNAELVNTYWKLTELSGSPAKPGAGHEDLHKVKRFAITENDLALYSGDEQLLRFEAVSLP